MNVTTVIATKVSQKKKPLSDTDGSILTSGVNCHFSFGHRRDMILRSNCHFYIILCII